MNAPKQTPRLTLGPLTGRIYVVTRYRERPNGVIEAQEKFDVTDEFLSLYEEATSKFTYTPVAAVVREGTQQP